MNRPTLVICGYSEAAMFLRRDALPHVVGIISIHGRREFGIDARAPHRIDLQFDDVEVAVPDDIDAVHRVTARRRWAEQNGLVETAPTSADARRIIEFAEELRGAEGLLVCHCGGGMSRAPAAALICLATWSGAGNEAECAAEVLRLRRGAVPHVGLIRFADDLLARQGKLLEALAAAQHNNAV